MKTPRFVRSRASSLWGCALALLLSATSAFATTETTNILLCATSNDASAAAANQAASGWTFSAPGAETQAKEGSYYYPVKFNSGTSATSASVATGSYMTDLVLGVKVSNVARTVTVTPYDASGTSGTPQTIAPGATGSLVDVSFSFTAAEAVSYVTVGIAGSGSATAYLYYATVTTETSSGGGVNTPPEATQPSMDIDTTVDMEVSVDLASCFTDADGDQLSFALVSGDGYLDGSVWSFTPTYEGSFSAEVSATDPSGDSATMTINVTVAEPSLMPLSAPWIEYVSPEDVSTNGFVLRWMDVDNAVGYDLVVTNVAEQMEVGCQVSYSGPNYPDDRTVTATVTGLDPDTLYAVAVRALADPNPFPSSGYSDSDWSDPVEIATTLDDGLLRAVLLDEGFSGADNAWRNTSAKPNDSVTDCDSWSFSDNTANGRSAIKVGGAGAVGWALSPEITLSNEVAWADVVLSFSAAAYPGNSTKFSVSLVDSATGETNAIPSLTALEPVALDSLTAPELLNATYYSAEIVAPTRFKILFETLSTASDKRLLLDSIQVTQVYDPNYAALAAPTGVAGSDIGKYGFTVSWNAVSNAVGYEVWLDGAIFESCPWTDTSMQVTGLSDGTAYQVQVRAIGDNLHYGDSPLSTAISVTTVEDVQKIDFTVTGAPAGDVFAGDAVSFTVTAENDSTHATAEVSFSGIAGATFTAATGAFSWTPTESDVGANIATFTSGAYSTNVTITVVSAFATETLATENFSKIASSSWTSTTGYATEMVGDIGTWTGVDIIKTKSAIIIGRRTSSGTIVSPAVELKTRTPGSFSVSFDTGSVPGAKASVQAKILDAADGTVLYTTNFPTVAALPSDATAVSDAGARFTVSPGPSVVLPAAVKVAFTTYESAGDNSQRAYVDTVVFEQTVSARIQDLAAPTGLALVGEAGETGFTVGWTPISGATNYVARVTDAGGAIVFSAPFCAATQATVTGLADDVSYTVQVRATGDESLYFASPWSDALAVRTARSALHPTLSFGVWQNAVGDGKVYGGLLNTAAVSAVRDNGSNAVVTLMSVQPAPTAGPALTDGLLSWRPTDADTNKTFTISFLMDGIYATNIPAPVLEIDQLAPPTVTVDTSSLTNADGFASGHAGLSWKSQYRATGYSVRAWTGCPNLNATATHVEETFHDGYSSGEKPAGWIFKTQGFYSGDKVKFTDHNAWLATWDLGGTITNVSFAMSLTGTSSGTESVLSLYGTTGTTNKTDWILLKSWSEQGAEISGTANVDVDAALGISRLVWQLTKENGGGNVGVGQVVIGGEGFSTPKFLPGWGPVAKDVGLVHSCTVSPTRPGRTNWVEVSVTDGTKTFSRVVEIDVPDANPVTLLILK